MKNRISEKTAQIRPSGIRKFFDIVAEMDDVVSLGVGEPDFDTPWAIRDEGIYTLERGKTFYTSNSGLKELREEICIENDLIVVSDEIYSELTYTGEDHVSGTLLCLLLSLRHPCGCCAGDHCPEG